MTSSCAARRAIRRSTKPRSRFCVLPLPSRRYRRVFENNTTSFGSPTNGTSRPGPRGAESTVDATIRHRLSTEPPMQSLQDHFLIAMPAMADPNFNETVTYICKHDVDGAFGIVINRPSDWSLGEMLS